jgi:CheY-like chemotaxis protein/HPt (histidine-containing phosphotransfer) domain-containing protein
VTLEFRVRDTGIGIPPERIGALFQAFSQVDASTTRKYGGTGLGLAICQRLVTLMGGQIGVESEPGKGSTFWFTVVAPVAHVDRPSGWMAASRLKGSRALVVDDNPTNLRLLRRQLELWGMEVAVAESATEALHWLEGVGLEPAVGTAAAPGANLPRWMPDLIVTDMHMPDMDGVMFARALRDHPAWKNVPLVLLSSGFLPTGDDNARLFDARLLKPARQAQLFETLARCLSSDTLAQSASNRTAADVRRHAAVLVADDNPVNLKVAGAMLGKLGYDVRTAVDGREAVDAVAEAMAQGTELAAVLMDVNMPQMDGLEATRLILQRWGPRAPAIIALTAAALPEDQARCAEAGMVDYLTKPLQVSALAQALERWANAGLDAPAAAPTTDASAAEAPAATNALAPTEPVMDFSRLEEFREFDDESLTMTREVVTLFLGDLPVKLQAIEAALAQARVEAVSTAAHALKGSAGNIGALALQSRCAEIEAAAQAQQLPADADAVMARLQTLADATRAALADWQAAGGAAAG